ncbi:hypothetical protein [Rhizobium rhizogenes]|uniref:hypothetical protein n=1 Tax=Rhizobium rhizogenes TaxID=359 RepID=UPI00226D80FB|nr:hypothetical protein [Rhizobium rhizogenes]
MASKSHATAYFCCDFLNLTSNGVESPQGFAVEAEQEADCAADHFANAVRVKKKRFFSPPDGTKARQHRYWDVLSMIASP